MQTTRKAISFVLTLAMIFTMVIGGTGLTFAASGSTAATTMKIAGTDGTVTITTDKGKDIAANVDTKLLNGYTIKTAAASYCFISLDDSKAIKLGQNTKVKVEKSNKKIELSLKSGEIFFDVDKKLSGNESMNIKTGNMTTGIRGTSGVAKILDQIAKLQLFSGSTQSKAVGLAGTSTTLNIAAGQELNASFTQMGEGTQPGQLTPIQPTEGTQPGQQVQTETAADGVTLSTNPIAMDNFAVRSILETSAIKSGVSAAQALAAKAEEIIEKASDLLQKLTLSQEAKNQIEKATSEPEKLDSAKANAEAQAAIEQTLTEQTIETAKQEAAQVEGTTTDTNESKVLENVEVKSDTGANASALSLSDDGTSTTATDTPAEQPKPSTSSSKPQEQTEPEPEPQPEPVVDKTELVIRWVYGNDEAIATPNAVFASAMDTIFIEPKVGTIEGGRFTPLDGNLYIIAEDAFAGCSLEVQRPTMDGPGSYTMTLSGIRLASGEVVTETDYYVLSAENRTYSFSIAGASDPDPVDPDPVEPTPAATTYINIVSGDTANNWITGYTGTYDESLHPMASLSAIQQSDYHIWLFMSSSRTPEQELRDYEVFLSQAGYLLTTTAIPEGDDNGAASIAAIVEELNGLEIYQDDSIYGIHYYCDSDDLQGKFTVSEVDESGAYSYFALPLYVTGSAYAGSFTVDITAPAVTGLAGFFDDSNAATWTSMGAYDIAYVRPDGSDYYTKYLKGVQQDEYEGTHQFAEVIADLQDTNLNGSIYIDTRGDLVQQLVLNDLSSGTFDIKAGANDKAVLITGKGISFNDGTLNLSSQDEGELFVRVGGMVGELTNAPVFNFTSISVSEGSELINCGNINIDSMITLNGAIDNYGVISMASDSTAQVVINNNGTGSSYSQYPGSRLVDNRSVSIAANGSPTMPITGMAMFSGVNRIHIYGGEISQAVTLADGVTFKKGYASVNNRMTAVFGNFLVQRQGGPMSYPDYKAVYADTSETPAFRYTKVNMGSSSSADISAIVPGSETGEMTNGYFWVTGDNIPFVANADAANIGFVSLTYDNLTPCSIMDGEAKVGIKFTYGDPSGVANNWMTGYTGTYDADKHLAISPTAVQQENYYIWLFGPNEEDMFNIARSSASALIAECTLTLPTDTLATELESIREQLNGRINDYDFGNLHEYSSEAGTELDELFAENVSDSGTWRYIAIPKTAQYDAYAGTFTVNITKAAIGAQWYWTYAPDVEINEGDAIAAVNPMLQAQFGIMVNGEFVVPTTEVGSGEYKDYIVDENGVLSGDKFVINLTPTEVSTPYVPTITENVPGMYRVTATEITYIDAEGNELGGLTETGNLIFPADGLSLGVNYFTSTYDELGNDFDGTRHSFFGDDYGDVITVLAADWRNYDLAFVAENNTNSSTYTEYHRGEQVATGVTIGAVFDVLQSPSAYATVCLDTGSTTQIIPTSVNPEIATFFTARSVMISGAGIAVEAPEVKKLYLGSKYGEDVSSIGCANNLYVKLHNATTTLGAYELDSDYAEVLFAENSSGSDPTGTHINIVSGAAANNWITGYSGTYDGNPHPMATLSAVQKDDYYIYLFKSEWRTTEQAIADYQNFSDEAVASLAAITVGDGEDGAEQLAAANTYLHYIRFIPGDANSWYGSYYYCDSRDNEGNESSMLDRGYFDVQGVTESGVYGYFAIPKTATGSAYTGTFTVNISKVAIGVEWFVVHPELPNALSNVLDVDWDWDYFDQNGIPAESRATQGAIYPYSAELPVVPYIVDGPADGGRYSVPHSAEWTMLNGSPFTAYDLITTYSAVSGAGTYYVTVTGIQCRNGLDPIGEPQMYVDYYYIDPATTTYTYTLQPEGVTSFGAFMTSLDGKTGTDLYGMFDVAYVLNGDNSLYTKYLNGVAQDAAAYPDDVCEALASTTSYASIYVDTGDGIPQELNHDLAIKTDGFNKLVYISGAGFNLGTDSNRALRISDENTYGFDYDDECKLFVKYVGEGTYGLTAPHLSIGSNTQLTNENGPVNILQDAIVKGDWVNKYSIVIDEAATGSIVLEGGKLYNMGSEANIRDDRAAQITALDGGNGVTVGAMTNNTFVLRANDNEVTGKLYLTEGNNISGFQHKISIEGDAEGIWNSMEEQAKYEVYLAALFGVGTLVADGLDNIQLNAQNGELQAAENVLKCHYKDTTEGVIYGSVYDSGGDIEVLDEDGRGGIWVNSGNLNKSGTSDDQTVFMTSPLF